MNEQSTSEKPVDITDNTVEKIVESVVDLPIQSPVKRVVRKPAEKKIAPTMNAALEGSEKTSGEVTVETPIEKLADFTVPEENTAELTPVAPEFFVPAAEIVAPAERAIQSAEFKPAPPMPDPRRRLRELLAIPDRDRTDALWDELIELEIQLAPGNRVQSPNVDANAGRHQKSSRFADPGRRPASSPNAGRHHRPNAAHSSASNAGPGTAAPHGAGGADTPRPAKRFFKKPRRGPRPPDKV